MEYQNQKGTRTVGKGNQSNFPYMPDSSFEDHLNANPLPQGAQTGIKKGTKQMLLEQSQSKLKEQGGKTVNDNSKNFFTESSHKGRTYRPANQQKEMIPEATANQRNYNHQQTNSSITISDKSRATTHGRKMFLGNNSQSITHGQDDDEDYEAQSYTKNNMQKHARQGSSSFMDSPSTQFSKAQDISLPKISQSTNNQQNILPPTEMRNKKKPGYSQTKIDRGSESEISFQGNAARQGARLVKNTGGGANVISPYEQSSDDNELRTLASNKPFIAASQIERPAHKSHQKRVVKRDFINKTTVTGGSKGLKRNDSRVSEASSGGGNKLRKFVSPASGLNRTGSRSSVRNQMFVPVLDQTQNYQKQNTGVRSKKSVRPETMESLRNVRKSLASKHDSAGSGCSSNRSQEPHFAAERVDVYLGKCRACARAKERRDAESASRASDCSSVNSTTNRPKRLVLGKGKRCFLHKKRGCILCNQKDPRDNSNSSNNSKFSNQKGGAIGRAVLRQNTANSMNRQLNTRQTTNSEAGQRRNYLSNSNSSAVRPTSKYSTGGANNGRVSNQNVLLTPKGSKNKPLIPVDHEKSIKKMNQKKMEMIEKERMSQTAKSKFRTVPRMEYAPQPKITDNPVNYQNQNANSNHQPLIKNKNNSKMSDQMGSRTAQNFHRKNPNKLNDYDNNGGKKAFQSDSDDDEGDKAVRDNMFKDMRPDQSYSRWNNEQKERHASRSKDRPSAMKPVFVEEFKERSKGNLVAMHDDMVEHAMKELAEDFGQDQVDELLSSLGGGSQYSDDRKMVKKPRLNKDKDKKQHHHGQEHEHEHFDEDEEGDDDSSGSNLEEIADSEDEQDSSQEDTSAYPLFDPTKVTFKTAGETQDNFYKAKGLKPPTSKDGQTSEAVTSNNRDTIPEAEMTINERDNNNNIEQPLYQDQSPDKIDRRARQLTNPQTANDPARRMQNSANNPSLANKKESIATIDQSEIKTVFDASMMNASQLHPFQQNSAAMNNPNYQQSFAVRTDYDIKDEVGDLEKLQRDLPIELRNKDFVDPTKMDNDINDLARTAKKNAPPPMVHISNVEDQTTKNPQTTQNKNKNNQEPNMSEVYDQLLSEEKNKGNRKQFSCIGEEESAGMTSSNVGRQSNLGQKLKDLGFKDGRGMQDSQHLSSRRGGGVQGSQQQDQDLINDQNNGKRPPTTKTHNARYSEVEDMVRMNDSQQSNRKPRVKNSQVDEQILEEESELRPTSPLDAPAVDYQGSSQSPLKSISALSTSKKPSEDQDLLEPVSPLTIMEKQDSGDNPRSLRKQPISDNQNNINDLTKQSQSKRSNTHAQQAKPPMSSRPLDSGKGGRSSNQGGGDQALTSSVYDPDNQSNLNYSNSVMPSSVADNNTGSYNGSPQKNQRNNIASQNYNSKGGPSSSSQGQSRATAKPPTSPNKNKRPPKQQNSSSQPSDSIIKPSQVQDMDESNSLQFVSQLSPDQSMHDPSSNKLQQSSRLKTSDLEVNLPPTSKKGTPSQNKNKYQPQNRAIQDFLDAEDSDDGDSPMLDGGSLHEQSLLHSKQPSTNIPDQSKQNAPNQNSGENSNTNSNKPPLKNRNNNNNNNDGNNNNNKSFKTNDQNPYQNKKGNGNGGNGDGEGDDDDDDINYPPDPSDYQRRRQHTSIGLPRSKKPGNKNNANGSQNQNSSNNTGSNDYQDDTITQQLAKYDYNQDDEGMSASFYRRLDNQDPNNGQNQQNNNKNRQGQPQNNQQTGQNKNPASNSISKVDTRDQPTFDNSNKTSQTRLQQQNQSNQNTGGGSTQDTKKAQEQHKINLQKLKDNESKVPTLKDDINRTNSRGNEDQRANSRGGGRYSSKDGSRNNNNNVQGTPSQASNMNSKRNLQRNSSQNGSQERILSSRGPQGSSPIRSTTKQPGGKISDKFTKSRQSSIENPMRLSKDQIKFINKDGKPPAPGGGTITKITSNDQGSLSRQGSTTHVNYKKEQQQWQNGLRGPEPRRPKHQIERQDTGTARENSGTRKSSKGPDMSRLTNETVSSKLKRLEQMEYIRKQKAAAAKPPKKKPVKKVDNEPEPDEINLPDANASIVLTERSAEEFEQLEAIDGVNYEEQYELEQSEHFAVQLPSAMKGDATQHIEIQNNQDLYELPTPVKGTIQEREDLETIQQHFDKPEAFQADASQRWDEYNQSEFIPPSPIKPVKQVVHLKKETYEADTVIPPSPVQPVKQVVEMKKETQEADTVIPPTPAKPVKQIIKVDCEGQTEDLMIPVTPAKPVKNIEQIDARMEMPYQELPEETKEMEVQTESMGPCTIACQTDDEYFDQMAQTEEYKDKKQEKIDSIDWTKSPLFDDILFAKDKGKKNDKGCGPEPDFYNCGNQIDEEQLEMETMLRVYSEIECDYITDQLKRKLADKDHITDHALMETYSTALNTLEFLMNILMLKREWLQVKKQYDIELEESSNVDPHQTIKLLTRCKMMFESKNCICRILKMVIQREHAIVKNRYMPDYKEASKQVRLLKGRIMTQVNNLQEDNRIFKRPFVIMGKDYLQELEKGMPVMEQNLVEKFFVDETKTAGKKGRTNKKE